MAVFNITSKLSSMFIRSVAPLFSRQCYVNPVPLEAQEKQTKDVISSVNNLITDNSSRAFAIIHLAGKQWRVTDGDLLVVEGYWPPTIGDAIVCDKILLAGTKDFTVIGRPLVQAGFVTVTATVISKGLSHTRTHFKKKSKKQYMRINFNRQQQTMLRINSVAFSDNLNKPPNEY